MDKNIRLNNYKENYDNLFKKLGTNATQLVKTFIDEFVFFVEYSDKKDLTLDIIDYTKSFPLNTFNEMFFLIKSVIDTALKELKGVFKKNELMAIADVTNSWLLTSDFKPFFKEILKAQIEDGDKYEYLCKKWDVDLNEILSKIDKQSAIHLWVLVRYLKTGFSGNNLDKKIESLL